MKFDKLGDLFLISEDGLSSARYSIPINVLFSNNNNNKYDNIQDSKIKKRQENILFKVKEKLSLIHSSPHLKLNDNKIDICNLSRDYNQSFQQILLQIKKLNPNTRREDRMQAYTNMAHLGEDFMYTVKTYGRIIISEVYLNTEKKTIKPSSIGGIAGGDKFIVQNILFKFAINKGLYSDDESAMKVAGHDLKALSCLFNTWVPDLYYPLLALLDYRGFRLVAMTVLPINGLETLTYGSSDAGATMYQNPEVHKLLETVAKRLNIREHPVLNGKARVYTPIDLEVHEGTDDKYYLLDFSRTLPPQTPVKEKQAGYLYQHFRSEFVKQYPKPLCSDAFSSFIRIRSDNPSQELKDEAKDIHNDIIEATNHLKNITIPNFVTFLCELSYNLRKSINIIQELHYYGINIRYLGIILEYIQKRNEQYWESVIIVEMISRVCKDLINRLLREKMQEFKYPGEGIYRRQVVLFLNNLIGKSEITKRLWENQIYIGLLSKFGNNIGNLKQNNINIQYYDIIKRSNKIDGKCLLLMRLADLVGIRYSNAMWAQLNSSISDLFKFENPFDETDIKIMKERVRQMNIISHSQGFMLRLKGMLTYDPKEKQRLLTMSSEYFSKAIDVCPNSKVSLRNYADTLLFLDKTHAAGHQYKKCLQLDPNDTNTLFKYGYYLDITNQFDKAEEYYLRSIEANLLHSNVYCIYADFLFIKRNNIEMAEEFYKYAIKTDKTNRAAYNNYAILLIIIKKDYKAAEDLLKQANSIERGTETPRRFLNLATLYHNYLNDIKQGTTEYSTYKVMLASSLKISSSEINLAEEEEDEEMENFIISNSIYTLDSYYSRFGYQ